MGRTSRRILVRFLKTAYCYATHTTELPSKL